MNIQGELKEALGLRSNHEPRAKLSIIRSGSYRVRLAASEADRSAIYRLRFEVFNLELNEGLESAFLDGRDTDLFDTVCDHLLVEHVGTGRTIGTYRLQTGAMAENNFGYYSAREFNFAPYESLGSELLELGRACIHRDHRSLGVLTLLWRGLARYAMSCGSRYLIGCSSLTSQDPAAGWAMYRRLRDFIVEPRLRTFPLPEFAIPEVPSNADCQPPPKLLRAYLSIGAQICGPPAIDREFKTIDFLTLLDLNRLSASARERFLSR